MVVFLPHFLLEETPIKDDKKTVEINEQIRDKEIRVVASDGAQLGIMSAAAAQHLAEDQNLDLVKIAPNATPPVCKIMDYSKFKYEQAKKDKEAKKKQKVVEVKTVQLSMTIDENDIRIKAKSATKWLQDGNNVKVSLRMFGRQQAYSQNAVAVVLRFCEMLSDIAKMDKPPKVEGRYVNTVLMPIISK